jgi:spore coat protein U-like protein
MKRWLALLALCAAAWSAPTQAQSCSLTAGSSTLVDFGAYTSISGTADALGTLNLNCTPGILGLPVSYSIAFGAGSAGSFNPRKFTGAAGTLNYNLYRDPTRLLVWGDGSATGAARQSGVCAGACSILVYGRLFGGQAASAGTYSDSVLVTLEF